LPEQPSPPRPAAALTFRAGREDDQPQIAEMVRTIWEGNDYLPKLWVAWVQEPASLLRVGLLGEEIVATGRVVELTRGGWWLEGMRVHPAHQGKGFATRLHDHLVALALQQPEIRSLGLTTEWDNEKIQHLARRSGMELRAEYRYFRGDGLAEPATGVTHETAVTLASLAEWLRGSRWLEITGGHAMDGWVARPLDEAWLGEIIKDGGVWRCGEALALVGRGGRGRDFWLHFLDQGGEQEQEALARHARHLAYQQGGDAAVRCFVPVDARLHRPLLAAGMQDPWDDDEEFRVHHYVREV
jgi:RimJ/RimL family protein N-acetyltransferase